VSAETDTLGRMGIIYFIIMMGLGGAVAVFLTRRNRPQGRTRKGPIPGYSFTPGTEVELGDELLKGMAFETLSLEEFHSPDRTRLILTLESDDESLDPALPRIASDLQARAHANVVMVERLRTDGAKLRHLYSPDGKGWTGQETLVHLSA